MRLPAFGLVACVALAAGCGQRALDAAGRGARGAAAATCGLRRRAGAAAASDWAARAGSGTFTPTRKLDILFVIDDSSLTRLAQDNLLRNFPTMMTTLRSAPRRLPDLHLAVISTDMGAGDGSIAGCDSTGGKNGIFQYTARGTCTATGLASGRDVHLRQRHGPELHRRLPDVFACIAALGESGCGFEHQLAAISRALGADGRPPPAENQGFLRPDAYLSSCC